MYPLSSKQKALRFSPFSQAGLKRWSPLILDQPSCSTLRAALVFTFRRSKVGVLQAQRCSRSQQRGPVRADPMAQQMELRLGEKVTPTPLALPENQSKRLQPRRTSHKHAHTKTTTSTYSNTYRHARRITHNLARP